MDTASHTCRAIHSPMPPSARSLGGRYPASLQLIGPDRSEELLVAAGAVVEAAVAD